MDVLVPLKRLGLAKSRLSGSLEPSTRERLMRALVDHTLAAATAARRVDRVVLVSSEPESRRIARLHGADHFDDRGLAWNDALAAAMAECVTAEAVTIVAGDLPLLAAADVDVLIAALPGRGVAIARARDAGTNAVAMRPAGAMPTCFGTPGSAARHAELAAAHGLEAAIVDVPGLALDLDSPEDLAEVLERGAPEAIRAALAGIRAA